MRIRAVSHYGQMLTGRPIEQIQGIPVELHSERWAVYHSDGVTIAQNEELPLTRATLHGETVKEEEWVIRRPDGTQTPILCTAAPIRDAEGRITGGVIGWQDLTERKRMEQSLRHSEERLKLASEATGFGWFDYYPSAGRLVWSEAAKRHFGLGPEAEVDYEVFLKGLHPDDRDRVDRVVQAATRPEGGGFYKTEYRTIGIEDGVERWLSAVGRIFFDASGRATRFIGTTLDVTERKKAESALEAERARLQAVLDSLPVAVWIADKTGTVVQVNSAVDRVWGKPLVPYGIEEYGRYKGWWSASGEPLKAEDWALARAVLKGEVSTGEVIEIQRFDGARGTILNNASPIWDREGHIIGAVAVAQDITALRAAEESLRESESFFRQTLESIPGMVFTTRPDGYCDYQSQQWVDYTGVPMSEMLGDGWNRLLYPDDQQLVYEAWMAAVEERAPYDLEYRVRRHDGQYEWFKVMGRPIRDEHGKIVRWFGVALNIQALKEAEGALLENEEKLKRLVDNLARSNRDLQQFAYVASHDLQEPLRQVTGFVQLLDQRYGDQLDEPAREYMGFVAEGAKRMHSLIQDLLAYSRVDSAGREPVPVAVKEALDQALYNLALAIKENHATILQDDTLPTVHADRAQLVQVFQNLIGNAIKFRGEADPIVRIGAERRDANGGGAEWLFSVRDNGIGFEPQYADTLFELFRRLHSRQSYGGTGIGLTICKRVIERHGGRIWAESQPGVGSTFFFTLPAGSTE